MTMSQLQMNFILPLSPDNVYKETCSKSRYPETKLGKGMYCFHEY